MWQKLKVVMLVLILGGLHEVSAEPAQVDVGEWFELDIFKPGIPVYSDRSYWMATPPKPLINRTYVRTPIG